MAVLTLDLIKHSEPTPADAVAPKIITVCGNLDTGLKQLGFCPLFLQTLGPFYFQIKCKSYFLLKKEKDFGQLSNDSLPFLLR